MNGCEDEESAGCLWPNVEGHSGLSFLLPIDEDLLLIQMCRGLQLPIPLFLTFWVVHKEALEVSPLSLYVEISLPGESLRIIRVVVIFGPGYVREFRALRQWGLQNTL